jgi:hypothetical protein
VTVKRLELEILRIEAVQRKPLRRCPYVLRAKQPIRRNSNERQPGFSRAASI